MIIVCDLDGTLTDGHGAISAENAKVLRWAKKRGATCVLATSRPSRCLDLPVRHRSLFDCVITCDGAERTVPEPGGIRVALPPAAVHRAARALAYAGVRGAYAVEFGTELGHEDGYSGWPATDTGASLCTGTLRTLCGQGPVARVFFRPDDPGTLRAAADALAADADDGITCIVSEESASAGLVRFSHRSATKGATLRAWLAETGRTGRLIVFGDQLNDLSMLELADDGFAVGDAHPALLRRYTHLPNGDGSAVARTVFRMLEAVSPPQSIVTP